MMAFNLVLAMALLLASAPSNPDVEANEARYERFVYRWVVARWGAEEAEVHFLRTAKKKLPVDVARAWPVTPRGVLVNTEAKPTVFAWRGAGAKDEAPDPLPGALAEIETELRQCNDVTTEPALCVAGACFYELDCEYGSPGMWLAVRRDGEREVLAGALFYRRVPQAPKKEPTFKRWLDALDASSER